jgi:hypothetical protein
MPGLKKPPQKKVTYRRMITLTPPVAAKVEKLAEEEQRPVASMLRILVEHGLNAVAVK